MIAIRGEWEKLKIEDFPNEDDEVDPARLVVEHIDRALRVTAEGADLFEIYFGTDANNYEDFNGPWREYPNILSEFVSYFPQRAYDGFMQNIRACEEGDYLSFRMQGTLKYLESIAVDPVIAKELISLGLRSPGCVPLWIFIDKVWARRGLEQEIRGEFFSV